MQDDQTSAAKTVSSFEYLISKGFTFFIGPTWSFQANSIRSIIESREVIALVPAGSSDINGGASQAIFNLCPARSDQTPILTSWLKSRSETSAYLITPNGDWGEVHKKVYTDALKLSKIQILGEETFDFGADIQSLKAILLKAKLKKVGLLLVTGSGSDLSNIIRARNELKIPVTILGTNDIRDAIGMGLLPYDSVKDNVFVISLPVSNNFEKQYFSTHKEQYKLYSERGHDALLVLAKAIESTDGSVQNVKKYLKENIEFKGASGNIKFSEEGNVNNGAYYITPATEYYENRK